LNKFIKFFIVILWKIFFFPNKVIKNYNKISKKCIFIISLPRTGSTIFYNTLIYRNNFNYISNINLFLPYKKNIISKKFFEKIHYGFTNGLYGPSEFGPLKINFFYPNKKFDDYLKKKTQNNKFIIFKNTNFIFNIELLIKNFPNAQFILVKRKNMEIKNSLKKFKKELKKNYHFFIYPSSNHEYKSNNHYFFKYYDKAKNILKKKKIKYKEIEYNQIIDNSIKWNS